MMKKNGLILVLAVLVGGVAVMTWLDQPRRLRSAFAGDLYHQRYDEAARQLQPPSGLSVDGEGGLVLVDRSGRSVTVPAEKLPFKIAGGDGGPPHAFKMMALGPDTDGILDSPPVTLHLRIDGWKIVIEAVETD